MVGHDNMATKAPTHKFSSGLKKKQNPGDIEYTTKAYNVRRWHRQRIYVLRHEPLCRHCANRGETVPATEVDHIIPHRGHADPNFWRFENLQPLCASCHGRKTAKETNEKKKAKRNAYNDL